MAIDIRRAWTDPEYRITLSALELRGLPPNPAGEIESTDAELDAIVGRVAAGPTGWIRPPLTWSCPQPSASGCCPQTESFMGFARRNARLEP